MENQARGTLSHVHHMHPMRKPRIEIKNNQKTHHDSGQPEKKWIITDDQKRGINEERVKTHDTQAISQKRDSRKKKHNKKKETKKSTKPK